MSQERVCFRDVLGEELLWSFNIWWKSKVSYLWFLEDPPDTMKKTLEISRKYLLKTFPGETIQMNPFLLKLFWWMKIKTSLVFAKSQCSGYLASIFHKMFRTLTAFTNFQGGINYVQKFLTTKLAPILDWFQKLGRSITQQWLNIS